MESIDDLQAPPDLRLWYFYSTLAQTDWWFKGMPFQYHDSAPWIKPRINLESGAWGLYRFVVYMRTSHGHYHQVLSTAAYTYMRSISLLVFRPVHLQLTSPSFQLARPSGWPASWTWLVPKAVGIGSCRSELNVAGSVQRHANRASWASWIVFCGARDHRTVSLLGRTWC